MGTCFSHSEKLSMRYDESQLKALRDVELDQLEYPKYFFRQAKVVKVKDGDTIVIATYHNNQMCRFDCRLYAIDTPEKKSDIPELRETAIAATVFTSNKLLGKVVEVDCLTNRVINGKRLSDPFGRLFVRIQVEGKDFGQILIKNKLAREYYGGKHPYPKNEEVLQNDPDYLDDKKKIMSKRNNTTMSYIHVD